jgi:hypothetical protein
MKTGIISIVVLLVIASALAANSLGSNGPLKGNSTSVQSENGVKKFNSADEIDSFLKKNTERRGNNGYFKMALDSAAAPVSQRGPPSLKDLIYRAPMISPQQTFRLKAWMKPTL